MKWNCNCSSFSVAGADDSEHDAGWIEGVAILVRMKDLRLEFKYIHCRSPFVSSYW